MTLVRMSNNRVVRSRTSGVVRSVRAFEGQQAAFIIMVLLLVAERQRINSALGLATIVIQ